jgi:hypothetical protein
MDAWLKCEVSAGQFEHEASVKFCDYTGEELSLFVQKRDVQFLGSILGDAWIEGKLRVEVLDQKEGLSLIYLPGQTFNNGQSVTVADRQFEICSQSNHGLQESR